MDDQENSLSKERVFARLQSVDELPSMPQVMIMIRAISESPKSSAADLASVILKDQALTSKILRVANSAMYTGYSRQVSSVTQAVVLMGFQAVRSVAFGVMVLSMLRSIRSNKNFDFQRFWQESIRIAVAARMLAVLLGKDVPEEAFVAGFLCNLGELIIGQYFPDEYKKIEERVELWAERPDVEMRFLEVDHQEVGAWIAERWRFPKSLVDAIAHHHHPSLPGKTAKSEGLTEIVYVATWIANLSDEETTRTDQVEKIKNYAAIFLGLGHEKIDLLLQQYPDQVTSTINGMGEEENDPLKLSSAREEDGHIKEELPARELSSRLHTVQNQMAMLYEVASALREVENADEAYHVGLEGIFRAMQLERIILFNLDPEEKKLRGTIGFGMQYQRDVKELEFPPEPSTGALGKAFSEQRILNITDVRSAEFENIVSNREIVALKTSSFVVAPICAGSQSTAVLFADNQTSRRLVTEEEIRLLDMFIKQIELALARFV
jgi:HD-like signal output (HDOD) protein